MADSQSDGLLATVIRFATGASADGETPGTEPVDGGPGVAASCDRPPTSAAASLASAFSSEARSLRPGTSTAEGAASALRSALGASVVDPTDAGSRALASFACGAAGTSPASAATGGAALAGAAAGACGDSTVAVSGGMSGGFRSTVMASMMTSTADKASCSGSAKRNHQGFFGILAGATLSLAALRMALSSAAGGSSAEPSW